MIISPTNRKFLIAYVVLVGLPLLGLMGVLKVGRNISAPISVDGNWKLVTEAAIPADAPCARSLSSIQDALLTVSQSGKGLVLSLDSISKVTTSGVIEGKTVTASLPQPDGAADACSLNLLAAVDAKAEPRLMTGTLSVSGCPSCSVAWHAIHQGRSAWRGIH